MKDTEKYVDGLAQDCSNYIAVALDLLQSCPKPSIYFYIAGLAIWNGKPFGYFCCF